MKNIQRDQSGTMSPLLIPFIVVIVVMLVFSVTTVMYYNKYKQASTNLSGQIESAQAEAVEQQKKEDAATFAEKEKEPYKVYQAPANVNAISINFPKTWSDYVDLSKANSSLPLDFYANPDYVPAQTSDTRYALRIQLTNRSYDQVVNQYNSKVRTGKATSSPITLNGVQGVRIDGEIASNMNGSVVILPIRGNTLLAWTESQNFVKDFDNIILPNIKFNP